MARNDRLAKATAAFFALALAACGGEEAGSTSGASPDTETAVLGEIFVNPGYVRAVAPGALTSAGYLTLTSEKGDRLIGVKSGIADVEIHTMEMAEGVMKMRKVEAIELPAGKEVALEQGADHLMLINPAVDLTAGSTTEITLIFEKAGEVTVTLPVEQR